MRRAPALRLLFGQSRKRPPRLVAFRDQTVGGVCPRRAMLAAQSGFKNAIADAYGLRCKLDQFLFVDPFEGRVETHDLRRRQTNGLVVTGGADIGELLFA